MLVLGQAPPGGALSSTKCCSPLTSAAPSPSLFSNRRPKFFSRRGGGGAPSSRKASLALAKADDAVDSSTPAAIPPPPPPFELVGQEDVPLEGVIQFEKPRTSSPVDKWGRIALLAGGDVLALLFFSAIGRFSHGFPVFDVETLRTADPFVAGWFLGAYFLGGYSEDGRGLNGLSKGVLSVAKSWAVGIPLGITIRAVLSGHIPPYTFILVTMGSTAVLLIGGRALLYSVLPNDQSKKNDVYRRGSPFELFELLTSLVRRW
ncbi:uncharacterized protein LOC116214163 [Punica granatum]|uniref:Uncharacterized protein n=2 Tax=Punica granatum TaxID=22663 RepID=A0A218WDM4_PUNGR|nr:uncharacterized protein LOC116214163 [Punica granatum]OWM70776.1 hypothetical protein CDL15_Pgr014449 [Punica granatum]PKI41714.1 hypothetical protein CRG98_037916 [Punica granatum]